MKQCYNRLSLTITLPLVAVILATSSASAELSPDQVWAEIAKIRRDPSPEQRVVRADELYAKVDQMSKNYILGELCEIAFDAGNFDRARKCAGDLLTWAGNNTRDWSYGNAVHNGNIILGKVALKENEIDEASSYLLKAADVPGSPQLDTIGPDSELAAALLAKGRVDDVRKYSERCGKFWENGADALKDWNEYISYLAGKPNKLLSFFEYDANQSKQIADEALGAFWGKAKLASGKTVEPENEADRVTIPISPDQITRAVRAGTTSGLALRCGLPWKENFSAFMKSQRAQKLSEKQVTFSAVLHGLTMQRTVNRSGLLYCSDEVKGELKPKMLGQSDGPSSAG